MTLILVVRTQPSASFSKLTSEAAFLLVNFTSKKGGILVTLLVKALILLVDLLVKWAPPPPVYF